MEGDAVCSEYKSDIKMAFEVQENRALALSPQQILLEARKQKEKSNICTVQRPRPLTWRAVCSEESWIQRVSSQTAA